MQRENGDTFEDLVMAHLKGNHKRATAIHKILTLEHLHRLFLNSI